ncbi:MAG: response regulator [Pseudomonadota bacterium]
MKVLVVEDDPNLRALWGAVIEQAGFEAHLVETEPAAREMLMARPFDLVLLDLFLGETDGTSVASFATHLNPSCQVVVITGTAVYGKRELYAMAPSIRGVMRKPVNIEDIMALCAHVAKEGTMPPPEALTSGGADFRS